ncbi:MAG: B3/4 domain-containing protein [Bacillota bacterium]|jgi:DNA/RNA-binding domain of Phe-tRNA-synthetase-like protein
MRFLIDPEVFEVLPTMCIGVVVAHGIDNTQLQSDNAQKISALLSKAMRRTRAKFAGTNVKEHPDIVPYREAFRALGYNPNKFPCSVEALTSRVVKGSDLPDINSVVNLVNAVSLELALPMGAHDLDSISGDLAVRFSRQGELFTPLGEAEPEEVPAGELVYADGREIRTRRWIWRQNDRGKVTEESRNIFFPIDGFTDRNRDAVERAMAELAGRLEEFFGVAAHQYFLDRDRNSCDLMASAEQEKA